MKGKAVIATALMLFNFMCQAGAYGDDLTKCLLSNATDDDRENILKWQFVLAAKYPANSKFYSPPELTDEMTSLMAAATFYRLTDIDCKKEKDIAEKLEGKPSVANSLAMLTNSSWGRLYKSQAVNDYIAMTDNFYAKEKRKAEEKAKR